MIPGKCPSETLAPKKKKKIRQHSQRLPFHRLRINDENNRTHKVTLAVFSLVFLLMTLRGSILFSSAAGAVSHRSVISLQV